MPFPSCKMSSEKASALRPSTEKSVGMKVYDSSGKSKSKLKKQICTCNRKPAHVSRWEDPYNVPHVWARAIFTPRSRSEKKIPSIVTNAVGGDKNSGSRVVKLHKILKCCPADIPQELLNHSQKLLLRVKSGPASPWDHSDHPHWAQQRGEAGGLFPCSFWEGVCSSCLDVFVSLGFLCAEHTRNLSLPPPGKLVPAVWKALIFILSSSRYPKPRHQEWDLRTERLQSSSKLIQNFVMLPEIKIILQFQVLPWSVLTLRNRICPHIWVF